MEIYIAVIVLKYFLVLYMDYLMIKQRSTLVIDETVPRD